MVFAVSYVTSAYGSDQFEGKVTWKSVKFNCVFMNTVIPNLLLNEDALFENCF
jgi:hypothetical protein